MLNVMRQGVCRQRGHQRVRHAVGDDIHVGVGCDVAALPGKTCLARVVLARRVQPRDAMLRIHDLQTPADMNGRCREHLATIDQRKLGGAAADVDIKDAFSAVVRGTGGAGAVSGEHGLHVVARGGADELAALLGEDAADGLRVFAP